MTFNMKKFIMKNPKVIMLLMTLGSYVQGCGSGRDVNMPQPVGFAVPYVLLLVIDPVNAMPPPLQGPVSGPADWAGRGSLPPLPPAWRNVARALPDRALSVVVDQLPRLVKAAVDAGVAEADRGLDAVTSVPERSAEFLAGSMALTKTMWDALSIKTLRHGQWGTSSFDDAPYDHRDAAILNRLYDCCLDLPVELRGQAWHGAHGLGAHGRLLAFHG